MIGTWNIRVINKGTIFRKDTTAVPLFRKKKNQLEAVDWNYILWEKPLEHRN